MSNETILWSGRPSQAINLPSFVLCALMCLTIFLIPFAIIVAVIKYLQVRTTKIEVTSQRLKMQSGIISKKLDEMELYRVRDIRLTQPLPLRFFKLSSISLVSSDATTPIMQLNGILDAYALRERIRNCVEARRDLKGVRDLEVIH